MLYPDYCPYTFWYSVPSTPYNDDPRSRHTPSQLPKVLTSLLCYNASMRHKPKHHRFRFSLRALLVLVAIIGAGFGWLGAKIRVKQQERAAIIALSKSDGKVHY